MHHMNVEAHTPTSTIADVARELEEETVLFEDMRDRIEYVIELGKELPPLAEQHRTELNKVRGCQSQVWLVAERGDDGRLHLEADSDAIIVKGLIVLLLRLYDRRSPREILDNPPEVLERIGLSRFLTPGRANGLAAMVARIRQIAEVYANKA